MLSNVFLLTSFTNQIDSGVNVDHEIFGGRAVMKSVNNQSNQKLRDLDGHGKVFNDSLLKKQELIFSIHDLGTAVAGVAAKVAKKAKIIGISTGGN